MSEKKHELLLIFAALVISAVLMLYSVLDSPKYAPLEATLAPATEKAATAAPKTETGTVNINTAGLDELMTLDGIGEERAKAIIEYRSKNGRFRSVRELENVAGIGSATVDKNIARLAV